MNRLPQELIDKIMSSLLSYRQARKSWSRLHEYEEPVPSKDWLLKWAAIAALGPQMQVAIEQDTFRDLNITSTEIETLGAMVSRYGHRAHFIKSISYLIVLPPSIEVHGVGKDEEIRVNKLAVTEAMSQLLLFLSRFPGLATVDLDITSGSVNNYIDGNDTARQGRRRYFGTNLNGIITLRSYLRVSAIQNMPIAPCVRSWSIGQASDVDPYVAEKMKYPVTYQFDPETSFALSKKFPNANSAHVRFEEIDFFNHYRQEQRRRLIQAVQPFELPSTTSNLSIQTQTPGTFKSVPAPFLGPRGESWGSTMHRALGNIENFTYHGPVEPSFFWPYGPLENPKPFWPFLACLSISFDMVSSSGQPFFHSMVQDTISRGVGVKKDPRGMLPPGHGTREESRKASRYLNRVRRQASTAHVHLEEALGSEYYGRPDRDFHAEGLWELLRGRGLLGARSSMSEEVNPTMVFENITPTLEALAKAAGQMRSLQSLFFEVNPGPFHVECSVTYIAPGVHYWDLRAGNAEPVVIPDPPVGASEEFVDYRHWCQSLMPIDTKLPRVYFDTKDLARWRPNEQLLSLFRSISHLNYNQDASLYSGQTVKEDRFGLGLFYLFHLYQVVALRSM